MKFNERKFYINLALFFLVGIAWLILDSIFDKTTNMPGLLITSFFIVWNMNQCSVKEELLNTAKKEK